MELFQSPADPPRASGLSSPHYASIELTPRTKVKRMLASLDDSDNDSPTERAECYNAGSRMATTLDAQTKGKAASPATTSSNNDSDVPQARRGTVAGRMQAQKGTTGSSSDGGSEEDAYRRVRRRLLSKTTTTKTTEAHPAVMARDDHDAPSGASTNQSLSSSPGRSATPGLFVSPDKPLRHSEHSSQHQPPNSSPRQAQTVAQKLKALAERRRQEARANQGDISESGESDVVHSRVLTPKPQQRQLSPAVESESDDADASKKLTQHNRPSRKASKKAIEEMHRETQRMSRNMQLTHEARTKTKFSTADLFAKFNFRQQGQASKTIQQDAQAASSSTAPSSNSEKIGGHETPPSSPPSAGSSTSKNSRAAARLHAQRPPVEETVVTEENMHELPDLQKLLDQRLQKAQSPYPPPRLESKESITHVAAEPRKRTSTKHFARSTVKSYNSSNGDDDLEIVQPREPSRLAIFDKLPASIAKEPNSLHALRALAHLHDSEKSRRKGRASMAPSELQVMLHQRARKQALQERDEKIQRLKDKGVIVQTAEEKEKEQLQLESMLERARKEAEEIAKREKDAAKREGKEQGDILDDDDDEDYQASDEGEAAQLSGSEEEGEDGDDGDEAELVEDAEDERGLGDDSNHGQREDEDERISNDFVENEPSDDGEDEASDNASSIDEGDGEGQIDTITAKDERKARRRIVDSDDEDNEEPVSVAQTPVQRALPATPASVKVPKTPKTATKDAFGFSHKKVAAPLGLSQVFAGTMAEEDQTQTDTPDDLNEDSMTFLRGLPAPEIPDYDDSLVMDSPRTMVEDSQARETPSRTASTQMTGLVNFDQQTQLPEPTQDDGFQVGDSQPLDADASYATVDTVPIERSPGPQPVAKQTKRRLLKRANPVVIQSDEEDDVQRGEEAGRSTLLDAFEAMREKRAEASKTLTFEKDKSKAKEMFEEQAEESEDEYAGLGGASDDEDRGEVDDETRKMIDDEGVEKTDERDIAAYYADKERREDEKGIEKLYKDVINGGLRRKRGADHGLWDSDDEDEAANRRRDAKQREFAKMRKALMAGEKIGKIAANPKQAAFLQALEDRDEMEDLDFLDQAEESQASMGASQQQESNAVQPLSSISGNVAGAKRTHAEYTESQQASQDAENMPPPANPRRSKAAKITRPTSLADIRNTLSEIIGEPESVLESQRLGSKSPTQSDDEDTAARTNDDEDDEALYRHPSLPSPPPERNPRRTNPTANKAGVINRIALKKQTSSMDRSTDSNQSRLAFQPMGASSFSSKVPSLLRRATSNASTGSMDTSAGPPAAAGGLGGKDVVKRGGSAKSSVNYYVRELERKGKLEKIEKERSEGRARVGKMRRAVLAGQGKGRGTGLGGLVGGSFD